MLGKSVGESSAVEGSEIQDTGLMGNPLTETFVPEILQMPFKLRMNVRCVYNRQMVFGNHSPPFPPNYLACNLG